MKLPSVTFFLYTLILCIGIGCKSNSTVNEFPPGSPEFKGREIFIRMACNACHSEDGSLKIGPTIKGQFGKEIRHIDGSVTIIDEEYIRESIHEPLKYIVEHYTPIMPSYRPILKDEDVENIIAYIKALK